VREGETKMVMQFPPLVERFRIQARFSLVKPREAGGAVRSRAGCSARKWLFYLRFKVANCAAIRVEQW